MISEEMLKQFIDIYMKKNGIKLSKKEAYEKGIQLLEMVKVVYRPIKNK